LDECTPISGELLKNTLNDLNATKNYALKTKAGETIKLSYVGYNSSTNALTFTTAEDLLGDYVLTLNAVKDYSGNPLENTTAAFKAKDMSVPEATNWSAKVFFTSNTEQNIIGTLTGGDAECGYPYDDYYQMLNFSWDYLSDSTQQLKYWLDPLNLDVKKLNGSGSGKYCIGSVSNLISLKHPECENGYLFGTACGNGAEFGIKVQRNKENLSGIGIYIGENSLSNSDIVNVNVYEISDGMKILKKSVPFFANILVSNSFNELLFPASIVLPQEFFVSIQIPQPSAGNLNIITNNSDQYDTRLEVENKGIWLSAEQIGIKAELPMCIYTKNDSFDTGDKYGSVLSSHSVGEIPLQSYNEDSIYLYPSPVMGNTLNIALRGVLAETVECRILDVNGIEWISLKRQLSVHGNIITLNVEPLPDGLYFVNIKSKGEIYTRRITIRN